MEAPLPVAVEDQVEVVEYLPGDVALAPYPGWVSSDRVLETLGGLLRRFHDATTRWEIPSGASWSQAFADPAGGPVICHNDVCIENVVFRDSAAAALLDFDFAAPGRRVWDVAQAARYWIPLTDPELPAAADRGVRDPIGRLRRDQLRALTTDLPAGKQPARPAADLDMCLLCLLLCVCPPAGLAYWLLSRRTGPARNGQAG
ncbi:MAG: phosphotransferase [Actinobacteria bacterium]|nr:phosphotransferase [Actinomycetota bacterium]